MLLSDQDMLKRERLYLLEGQRGCPTDWHYREVRAGLERRLHPDLVVRERNRARIRFSIRVIKARGLSPMRMPVRFLPTVLRSA